MKCQGTASARVSFVILTRKHKNGGVEPGWGWGSEEAWIFQPVQPHVTLDAAPFLPRSTSRLGSRNTSIHHAELCLHLDGRDNQGETDGRAGPAPSHVIFQGSEQRCSLFKCHGAATPGGERRRRAAATALGKKMLWGRHGDLQQVVCLGCSVELATFLCVEQASMN